MTLPPIDTKVIHVQFTQAERDFYNALLAKSIDIFEGFVQAGIAEKSWFAIFSLLARLRMACDHIALTVKSHINNEEWYTKTVKGKKNHNDNENNKNNNNHMTPRTTASTKEPMAVSQLDDVVSGYIYVYISIYTLACLLGISL